ncbi:MAG: hypothetical protein ABJC89_23975 [Acidobacteriota bacterium]
MLSPVPVVPDLLRATILDHGRFVLKGPSPPAHLLTTALLI